MRILLAAAAAVALLSACGGAPEIDDGDATDRMSGAEFSASIETGAEVTVSFELRNTGESTLVAYDRGWVKDGASPREAELTATREDVVVIVDGDLVEFGLRIVHGCHGNPQGELPGEADDGGDTDCGDAAVKQRIAASRVEPGETLSREYRFDPDSVWPDYPTDRAQTTVDLDGKRLRLCLGVDRPKTPADDDLYPPDAAERVLCGKSVAAG